MEYGICLQGVIPVRAEPGHTSEMVTQVLFGELFRISGHDGIWCRIQLVYDSYEGWVHHLQVHTVEEEEFLRLEQATTPVSMDLVQLMARESKSDMLPVPLGCSLPGIEDGSLTIDGETYHFEGEISGLSRSEPQRSGSEQDTMRRQLTRDAMLYLNAPYLWGGRTPMGIDCSGLIQMVYKLQHIQLLRDASAQAAQGEVIHLLFEALPGDLLFFDNEEGQINHVGMLLNRNSILHCSGQVRIDHLDQEGIFNKDLMKYTHKLRLIKRIF